MRWLLLVAFVTFVGCDKPELATSKRNTVPAGPAEVPRPPVADKLPATFPPADWTHRELAEHLGKKGVKVTVHLDPLHTTATRTAAWLYGVRVEDSTPLVLAYLCPNAREATEQAGAMGDGAFASGRFAIGLQGTPTDGSRALLQRVRESLR